MTSHHDSRTRLLGLDEPVRERDTRLACQQDLPDHVYGRHLIAAAALRKSAHTLAHSVSLDDLDDSDELDDVGPDSDGDDDYVNAQLRADDEAIEVTEALRAAGSGEPSKVRSVGDETFIDLAESRAGARIDIRTGGRVSSRLARTREVVARLAPKVLVPIAAITMLVIAMGGTWSTANATPTTAPAPWSVVRPPPKPSSSAISATASTSMIDDPPVPRTKVSRKDLMGKLNLNTASGDQLMMLPTVGPSKAERIVTWRKKNGGFKRAADLRRVKGFGYKTFKKLEPFLDIKGDTTLAPK